MPGCDKLPPRADVYDFDRSPKAELMDTVAHLQLEVEALMFVQSVPPALAMRTLTVPSKPVAFTSTKVPKFSGVTSWDQYRQVFYAIVRSNGWDDTMVALLLTSGRGCIECGPVCAGSKKSHVGRTGRGTNIMDHRTVWRIVDTSSRGRLVRKGKTRRNSPQLWKHLRLKRLETWARARDSGSYGTGSCSVMRTVPCDSILVVFHRRLPSGTLLTDVECVRATRTRRPEDCKASAGKGFTGIHCGRTGVPAGWPGGGGCYCSSGGTGRDQLQFCR